ncbi:hypothetical protein K440DRAFT_643307 [Wilcoxina mikolae CBS 423.85]|nr:hypothetical protein K440DRAFT_643307 [Wilcoxina mikolae CBS 423.85]
MRVQRLKEERAQFDEKAMQAKAAFEASVSLQKRKIKAQKKKEIQANNPPTDTNDNQEGVSNGLSYIRNRRQRKKAAGTRTQGKAAKRRASKGNAVSGESNDTAMDIDE